MLRLTGIFCGSALAVSLLIIALGLPDIVDIDDASAPVGPALVAAATDELLESEPDGQSFEPPVVPLDEPVVEPLAEPLVDTAVAGLVDELPKDSSAGDGQAPPLRESILETENWFAFWSPFRSQLAANGFVENLQRTTGMDYRVVKLKPGVYEVAFAYGNEADIENKLAAISAATGLDMPGG